MIDQNIAVYEKNNIYEFDNNIILHEYPRRIAEILIKEEAAAQSCLELGIGHGYSTEFFSKFFKNGSITRVKELPLAELLRISKASGCPLSR